MKSRLSTDLYDISEAALVKLGEDASMPGYGTYFENDVFQMTPFWWGDCDCEDTYPQTDAFYITHNPECRAAQPNFLHKRTGFWVEWYKYIGRSMEWDESITKEDWRKVYNECMDSLREEASE